MARNSKADEILKRVESKVRGDNITKWWTEDNGSVNRAVETTSYIALAQVQSDTRPILNWLIKQRNSQGGFKSTHDTVVALQAMVKIAQKYNNIDANLKIVLRAKDNEGVELERSEFLVNSDNALLMQKQEVGSLVVVHV